MWTEKNTGQLSLWSSEWKFLVAILFIEYITSAKTILLITPPSRLPFWLLLITRDVRAARRGGAVLARRVLLLKQDGCARRRSSGGGGELRQCRGGGGRGIYFCVSFLSCQKSNSPAEEETTRFRDGADLFPLPFTVTVFNGAFLFLFFLNGRTDQTNHGVWVEDSRGRSTPLPEMSLLCVGGKRGNERGRESLPVSCYWSITNCTSCLTEPAGYQLPAKVCMCMRVCVPSYCAE